VISYAQNFEDVILSRVFAGTTDGFFVDVGANDPTEYSVTRSFSDLGWRGINVEPASIYHKLVAARPRDVNLNIAVSDRDGYVEFHEFPDAHGLSGVGSTSQPLPASFEHLTRRRDVRRVPTRRLDSILAEHAPPTIHFLSVDVEGHERAVLSGNDWTRFRPIVVLVEATKPLSREPNHAGWEPILLAADYEFVYFDGLNRFYVRKEDAGSMRRHFELPPNVFDEFVTGKVLSLTARIAELEAALARPPAVPERRRFPFGSLFTRRSAA
jgi:FkbM family methyltransferase